MAGKPKNSKWGGKREGAGGKRKPPSTLSERAKKRYIAAALKLKREKGETLEYALLKLVYDDDIQDSVKASIMKTYNDALITHTTEQKISVTKDQGMAVRLPPKREDPALKIVGGKG